MKKIKVLKELKEICVNHCDFCNYYIECNKVCKGNNTPVEQLKEEGIEC